MNTIRNVLAGMMLAAVAGCSDVPVENATPTELVILQSWSGDYPVSELPRLPQGQQQTRVGYLGNAAAFAPVWAAFKPGEAVPGVDFGRQVVVFHRNVDFYNRTRIFKVTLRDGVADVLAMETMSAIPIEDRVAMAMAVISRANVKSLRSGSASVPVGAE
jgi:hypothetical protein